MVWKEARQDYDQFGKTGDQNADDRNRFQNMGPFDKQKCRTPDRYRTG